MARPKTISDEGVLDAAKRVLTRGGPAALTFAAVAGQAGLSPATLVQRYGSKEGLMRAALLSMWDDVDARTARTDAGQEVSVRGAIMMLVSLSAGFGQSGAETAQGLLLLREDFRDPVLRARGVAWGDTLAKALGRRLTSDVAQQERLGRLLASQWQGCLIWWGFSQSMPLRRYLKRELEDWCAVALR